MNPIIKEFEYGRHNIRIETGKIAKQTTGSVMVYMDCLLYTSDAADE